MCSTSSKARILIVDDEPLNVKLLAAMMPSDLYDTIFAHSGEEALEIMASEALEIMASRPPDLILLWTL